ncbi:MAG: methylated-DNA--[protein]-cysteine S-methyltransferase [Thermoplasmata archaeon]
MTARRDPTTGPFVEPSGLNAQAGSPAFKVVLGTSTPSTLQSLTARREDLTVEAYPMSPHLVLQVFGPEDDLDDATTVLQKRASLMHSIRGGGRITFVLEGGEAADEVIRLLADHAAHVVPPVRWTRGEAHVTLLVEEAVDLREVEALFPDGRLLSKRPLAKRGRAQDALRSPLFLTSLTQRQAAALATAFDAGYYDFPRRVTMEEVSQAHGMARSTLQEHLHKAEQHIIRAMLPFVRIRAAASGGVEAAAGEALSLYSRFSSELGLYVQLEVLGQRVRRVKLARDASRDAESSHPYLEKILEHLRTGKGDLRDIPLDLQVGPFEREVLEYLRTLRRGRTVTYGEIAQHLGRPRAARAVGRACARNPVPLVIPCHRVVPASGGLGNYSGEGGTQTKRTLLEREGAITAEGPGR